MSNAFQRATLTFVAAILLQGANAFGGISLVTEADGVQIIGSSFDATTRTAGTPFNQSSTATVNTPFSASLQNASVASPASSFTASASQNSLLTVSGQALSLSVTGQGAYASISPTGTGSTASNYYVVFNVDAPTPYTITESTSEEGFPITGTTDDADYGAALVAGQQALGYFEPGSLIPRLDSSIPLNAGPQTFSGTLSAGTYTLEGGYFGNTDNSSANGSLSVDFALGTASTGTGSGSGGSTNAVPLPAAFWPAIALISLIWLGHVGRNVKAHAR